MAQKNQKNRYPLAGPKIKEARQKKKLSMTGLGELMGVKRQNVQHWEKGNSLPPGTKLAKLCRILDLDERDLLQEHSDTHVIDLKARHGWPFHIRWERYERLGQAQKEQIEGAVRSLIIEFESEANSNDKERPR
jgi:transcriptional regulator with XRE-family HTH domain